jgi:hypothetical protein
MKKIFWLFVAIIPQVGIAQVTDTFSDGDFTANAVWQGTTAKFIVNGTGQLQLNDNIASAAYLTTPFTANNIDNYEWRFYIKMAFSPSGSNYGRVYLTSDSEDLTGPLNGYYLQFGEGGSNDAVQLFRQSGLVSVSICRASEGQIANSFELWIKVTRDENANWEILTANNQGDDYVYAASGMDATYTSSEFMGVRCTYTASNANKFFFDDFFAGDPLFDNTPPELVQVTATSENTLQLTFSEKLTAISASTLTHYLLNDLLQPATSTLLTDEKTVELNFEQTFDNASTNTLTVQGILDLAGNELIEDEADFFFFQQEAIHSKDIIFSEIMADPSPPQTLPEAEFIEIFNRSDKVINLNNVKLIDSSIEIVLPEYFLFPDAYVVLTSNASTQFFSNIENVISVSGFPTLTNGGELLLLKNLDNQTIDSLYYDDDWYKDDDKKNGGFTLERINQHNFCVEEVENWEATLSQEGGTPGEQNSVLNNTPDKEPPYVTAITVKSSNAISIYFSEKLHEELISISQFQIQPTLTIENLLFIDDKRNTIDVSFEEELQPSIIYSLKTIAIKDCSGNLSASLLDAGSFVLAEQASFQDVIITELLPDPSPVVGLPEVEFIELYNRSGKTINLKEFTITDGSSAGIIPDYLLAPYRYVLLLPETAISQYSESILNKVGVKNFPTLNNSGETISLMDSLGQKIDSISYKLDWYHDEDKQSGGWSLERKDLNNFCFEKENWRASIAATGGTPGFQNSVYTIMLDNTAPMLSTVFVESDNTLLLEFNERLHENSLSQLQLTIEPNREIESINFNLNNLDEVRLVLSQPLIVGEVYQLLVQGARDCTGNLMTAENISQPFGVSSQATWKDVIINEVMADPSPARALPEGEYIEILNRSDKLINLHNWVIKDNGSPSILSSQIILPDSFLILCSTQHAQNFSQYGATLALNNFPSLSNSGESITIRNAEGVLIDSINYKDTWYLDTDKKDGGWSLELIDEQNICAEETNWAATENGSGGTPGKENSIAGAKPDLLGPMLVDAFLISTEKLHLKFNEKLNQTLPAGNSFIINPELTISGIEFTDNSLTTLAIGFSSPATENTLYHLQAAQLYDCVGNAIQEDFNQISFVLPQQVIAGDLIINEILFNPLSGGVDFVEVLSVSNKYINLKNWKLANLENDEIINERNIVSANTVLHPNSYLVFTSDKEQLLNHYPQGKGAIFLETNLPSLPDDEGSIAITDSLYNILDHFIYTENMHSKLLQSVEGVSLERISLTGTTNDPTIWRSGVVSTGFASPGYKNANIKETFALTDEIRIEPEIFEPVYGQPNYTSINYKFEKGGYAANAKIYDAQGRLVKTLTKNEVLASEGFMTWDGDQDDGTKAHIGYYTLWLEVFDNTGFVKTFRKRVVVATRF